MQYSPMILQYFESPLHVGVLDINQPGVGMAVVKSAETGRVIELYVQFDQDDRITNATFKACGCPVTIAVAAFVADYLQQRSRLDAQQLTAEKIARHLNIPKSKYHCALLAEDAVKTAINH